MPAKLERCVERVKQKLIKDGVSPREAERSAWAICQDSLNKAKKKSKKNDKKK